MANIHRHPMTKNAILVTAINDYIHIPETEETDFINVNRRVKSRTIAFRLRIRVSLTSPDGWSIFLNLKSILFNFDVGSWMPSMMNSAEPVSGQIWLHIWSSALRKY